MDPEEEAAKQQQVARLATMATATVMFLVTMLGICSIFLPWWIGAAATKTFSNGVGEVGLDSTVTLWGYNLRLRVPISPDSTDTHTVTIDSDWSKWCADEELRTRSVPMECVTIEVTRAFSILTPIIALGATAALLGGLFEPLALLGGAALDLLSGVCAAIGVVCGVITGTKGLIGVGFFFLVTCVVLSIAALTITLYAAAKAMPLEDPLAGKEQSALTRIQRSKAARQEEVALAERLEANVRKGTEKKRTELADVEQGDTEPTKSYVHFGRVVEWLQKHHDHDNGKGVPLPLLEAAFQELDADASERIDQDELVKALKACGAAATQAVTTTIMRQCDKDDSNDIDIHEFVAFFKCVQDLDRFQNKSEKHAQFLTFVCSGCFLIHIIIVGVVLMIFIQMDEAETGPDNYSIIRNALLVCAINLGILFVAVIMIPAVKLTLGANVGAWRRHYEKRFVKGKKKTAGTSDAGYECRYRCGHKGSLKEVQMHEQNCPARGSQPLPKGGLRQAGWTSGAEEAPTVNAAIFGASYRVRRAQARLAELNRDWKECPNGCGFSGTHAEVAHHEYVCPLRRRQSVVSSSGDGGNAPPPPGVILNDDGSMRCYDPLAFRMEQTNQLSQRPLTTFVTMAGRDTAQHGANDRPSSPHVQLPALTDYSGNFGGSYR